MLLDLPEELIYHVISFLNPTSDISAANDQKATEDLLKLTLVCKATHIIANDFLLRRGAYLPSITTVDTLSYLLRKDGLYSQGRDREITQPSKAIIGFPSDPPEFLRPPRYLSEVRYTQTGEEYATMADGPPAYNSKNAFDVNVSSFSTFFDRVGHCLKRLVLSSELYFQEAASHRDFRQRRDRPVSYDANYTRVVEAFENLTALEEFACVRADRYFCPRKEDPVVPVWAYCPNLRRLLLPHVDVSSKGFSYGIRSLKHLTHLFLVCPYSLDEPLPKGLFSHSGPPTLQQITILPMHDTAAKQAQFDTWTTEDTFLTQMYNSQMDSRDTPGKITVLHINGCPRPSGSPSPTASFSMVLPIKSSPMDTQSTCERWLVDNAQQGKIWELDLGDDQTELKF